MPPDAALPRPALLASPLDVLRHPDVGLVFRRFVPVALALLALALVLGGRGLPVLLGLLHGLLWWSFLEYLLHRFVLHWEPADPGWQAFRRKLPGHRSHHNGPEDPDDTVTKRHALGLVLGPLGLLLMLPLGFPLPVALATVAGACLGYALYEYVHFSSHQLRMRTALGRMWKRHHGIHHFRDETVNFGVTSPLWDHVFGTVWRPDPSRGRGSAA